MRQERTVQASIFDLFAGHEIGRELKAMSAWLDGHRELASVVAAYLRRDGVKETGRLGLAWTNRAGLDWHYIAPASPSRTPSSRASIGRLRDELLNEEIFHNLVHARRLLERWRRDYNQVRPHSAHGGLTPAEARLLAAGARPGLVDGPAERPLAPSPSPCYQPEGLPS